MADNIIESTPASSAAPPHQPSTNPSSAPLSREVNSVYQLILSSINVVNSRNSGDQATNAPEDVAGPASALTAAIEQQQQQASSIADASVRSSATRPGIDQEDSETKRRRVTRESTDPVAGPSSSSPMTSVQQEKLESRLGGILCCAVCLDLPRMAMYQCQMGHLMCDACFTHLLADGRLRYQPATCPNCRVEISKTTATRNLAVEKAVSELPSECQYCSQEFRSKSIEQHEREECEERPVNCQYSRIGCQWKGPVHEAPEHEKNCLHPKKTGYELMPVLEAEENRRAEERKLFGTLIDLLSYEKIIFNDLQMKPYRSDDYVPRLFYETSRFSAFSNQFVVEGRVNKSQRDPHQSSERQISYQLKLKSKTSTPLHIHFCALRGPFSEIKLNTQIYKHVFTDENNESEFNILPLPDTSECNRLLAAKAINFRLLMFLLTN